MIISKKRGLFIFGLIFLAVFSIAFISAAYYGGGYNSFSLGGMLDALDETTVVLGVIFIISFAIINFALSRALFKDNKQVSMIVALGFSLLIIYGIHRSGYDYSGLFYNFVFDIGIPKEVLYSLMPFVLIAILLYMGVKTNFGVAFMAVATFFLALSLIPGIVYARGTFFFLSMLFYTIGFVIVYYRHKHGIVIRH